MGLFDSLKSKALAAVAPKLLSMLIEWLRENEQPLEQDFFFLVAGYLTEDSVTRVALARLMHDIWDALQSTYAGVKPKAVQIKKILEAK